jgi:serine protease AprX
MAATKNLARLFLAALVVSIPFAGMLHGGRFGPTVEAAPDKIKMSKDLYGRSGLVPVIIQTSATPSKSLENVIRGWGGSVKNVYSKVKGVAAELPAGVIAALAERSDILYISFDRPTQSAGHLEVTTGASLVRNYGTSSTGAINGTGIGIAVLDSGIYTAHHSFTGRIAASIDFTGENRTTTDPYGHGTHVAGVAVGISHVANGAYTGVAPGAKVINVRVLNSQGQGRTSDAIAGIDWCIANKAAYNIRVMNLSLGATAVDSYLDDPMCQAVRRAVQAGIVVCVAAGNMGKDSSGSKLYGAVHSPGIEPSAITVGAANTYGTNSRADDQVASYSSRGPTRGYRTTAQGNKRYDNFIKPDLIAPGNKIISAGSPGCVLDVRYPLNDVSPLSESTHEMVYMSGTSTATPAVAGAAALLLQRNPALTPGLVKAVLMYTADPINRFSNHEQGAGLLNVEGAVRLAGLIRQDLQNCILGSPLLVGPMPAQTSTIAGTTFQWSGGIIQKWNFIYGNTLIQKYQGIYGQGTLVADGVLLTDSTLLADAALLADGVLLSDGVLVADGTILADGTLVADGTILADGILMADGTILADGVLLSDSVAANNLATLMQALSVVGTGDATIAMPPVADTTLD